MLNSLFLMNHKDTAETQQSLAERDFTSGVQIFPMSVTGQVWLMLPSHFLTNRAYISPSRYVVTSWLNFLQINTLLFREVKGR